MAIYIEGLSEIFGLTGKKTGRRYDINKITVRRKERITRAILFSF